jgi:putative ABC transport system permease protein
MRGRRHLANLDQDIRDHIDAETRENIERGMSPDEAHFAALRKFGNRTLIEEDTRAVWYAIWWEQLLQDLRYAFRMLRRNPGFTLIAVLTLALGIGMNTAVFSVINAVLLRPLPYPDSGRLLWLSDYDSALKLDFAISAPDFSAFQTQAQVFDALAGYTWNDAAIATSDGAEEDRIASTAGDFWSITGARPAIGRLFGPKDTKSIVLSHQLFERGFGGDSGVIGRGITLDGRPLTIIGVLPRDFRFLFPAGTREPKEIAAYVAVPPNFAGSLNVVARLRPNVTINRARAEVATIQARIPRTNRALRSRAAHVEPLQRELVGDVRRPLMVLLGSVALVLLIAVLNIANLLLARAITRQREIATRVAIGAGRTRVVRQFLTESVLLAVLGGAAGLALARLSIAVLVRLGPSAIPRLAATRMDGRVLAFTLGLSVFTAILFGFGPAVSLWKTKLNDVLKEGTRTASPGPVRLRLRSVLAAAELALAIVLLTGAGLMLKSFWRMHARAPGFAPEKILTLIVPIKGPRYQTKPAHDAYVRELVDRLDNAPGIEAAGVECGTLLNFGPSNPFADKLEGVRFTATSAGYPRAIGMRLIKGRWLTNNEPAGAVLVNETFATRVFGSRDPIGQRIRLFGRNAYGVIVGVVSDVQRFALDIPTFPEVFMPYQAFAIPVPAYIAVRSTGDALAAAPSIEKLIRGIDPMQPVYDVRTLEDALANSIAPRRFNMILLATFAGVALLLALVGIYGVIAYSVTQRTHEIGVRMALGAQRADVIRMVVWQGMAMAIAGIVVGLAASIGLTRLMTSLLYAVKPADPPVFVVAAFALAATALLASWVPALRAALVDPTIALRYE